MIMIYTPASDALADLPSPWRGSPNSRYATRTTAGCDVSESRGLRAGTPGDSRKMGTTGHRIVQNHLDLCTFTGKGAGSVDRDSSIG